jgi:transposase
MNKITILAIDLAKHVFQLHGIDERGIAVLQRQIRRKQLLELLAQLPACTVAMEACPSAHYWGRKCRELGHHPRLIAAQYIKAFNRGQKNDRNDAQAIAIAARQPDMPHVAVKSEEQQGILALHRMRSLYSKERTALTNQLHGLLGEFGLALPRSVRALRRELTAALDRQAMPALLKQALSDQLEHLAKIEQRLDALTRQLELLARESTPCRQLMCHRGVGPIIATAFAAEVADPAAFKNGRQAAAWLGLVPRQYSSGGHTQLHGITKRGNCYLRQLMIHGARAAIRYAPSHTDPISRWSLAVQERRGANRAAVALANKTVRRMWATLRYAQVE